jgi:hypothetical protein
MAVPSDRERLVRLETRAREADAALRQLKSYVQLLKQKAGSPETAAQEVSYVNLSVAYDHSHSTLQSTIYVYRYYKCMVPDDGFPMDMFMCRLSVVELRLTMNS